MKIPKGRSVGAHGEIRSEGREITLFYLEMGL